METIKYVADPVELPESLPVDGLLMNGTGDVLPLVGGSTCDTNWITIMEDKEYSSMLEADELNRVDIKGALFSWNASTGKYHVWNADEIKVWDYTVDCSSNTQIITSGAGIWKTEVEFPTNEYGEVIAVCAGKGFWCSTKWDPKGNYTYGSYSFCNSSSSPLYDSYIEECFELKGIDVARKMYIKDQSIIANSIFDTVKNFEGIENDGTQGHWFVPSIGEMYTVLYNCAINLSNPSSPMRKNAFYNATRMWFNLSYGPTRYITCSQVYLDNYYNAQPTSIYVPGGVASKTGSGYCVICLHFGKSLVTA